MYRLPLKPSILQLVKDIEEVLESYLMDNNSMAAKLNYLNAQIQNTEDLVCFLGLGLGLAFIIHVL